MQSEFSSPKPGGFSRLLMTIGSLDGNLSQFRRNNWDSRSDVPVVASCLWPTPNISFATPPSCRDRRSHPATGESLLEFCSTAEHRQLESENQRNTSPCLMEGVSVSHSLPIRYSKSRGRSFPSYVRDMPVVVSFNETAKSIALVQTSARQFEERKLTLRSGTTLLLLMLR